MHRSNNHRYWFYDAGSDITSQLVYLKNLKKLSETELTRLSLGMTIPDEFLRKPTTIELPPRNPDPNRKQFSILDFVQKPRREASGNYADIMIGQLSPLSAHNPEVEGLQGIAPDRGLARRRLGVRHGWK